MKKFILATNNEHKVKEIKEILKDLPVEILSLKEASINIDVEEDGITFMENARKKAEEIYKILKDRNKSCIVMADDSGLMVDALEGAPGVYSARYAGEHGNSERNNEKLLEELKDVPFEERKARFVCTIALIDDEGKFNGVEGIAEGYISEKYSGIDGFGYDPLFFVPEYNKTFAEMTSEEKNSISHRGKALEKLKKVLECIVKP